MNGERVIRNPYDGSEAGRLTVSPPEGLENQMETVCRAFSVTRSIPLYRRIEILHRVASLIGERQEQLARIICAEAGKPVRLARAEVERAAATFRVAAAAAESFEGKALSLDANAGSVGRWGIVRRFPLGPVLAITPFNFPLNLTAHKVAPAMAVGAPILQKPASKTPLSAFALANIVKEAGWPEEAYRVVFVEGNAAEQLVTDPRLPVLSFTGSAVVGWHLKSLATKKRVALELGGNAGVIVHSDAAIDDAASRVVTGAFAYSGQVCISVQRVLVHESRMTEFREKAMAAARSLVMGDPADENTSIGPMISEQEAVRATTWIQEAVDAGARLLTGGGRQASIVEPSILESTQPGMLVEKAEAFAPLFTLNSYGAFDEALTRINESEYGLQAGVFTRDLGLVEKAFQTLEVGGVIVNDVPTWRVDKMPYGGVKNSGTGREGPAYAMEEFTEPRLLAVRVS